VLWYAGGSFDAALQIGPVVRTNLLVYQGPEAVNTPPTEASAAVEPVVHDVQVARSNGWDSLFVGLFMGLKGILGSHWGVANGLRRPGAGVDASVWGLKLRASGRLYESRRHVDGTLGCPDRLESVSSKVPTRRRKSEHGTRMELNLQGNGRWVIES
jgi:hypothetical protein